METKTNSKYLIGYLGELQRPLVLVLSKISGYVKNFNFKDGDNDKNNKLMSFHIEDDKLLEKYKSIWTKIEGLWNIKFSFLTVYENRYLKTKIRAYGDKVYTNYRCSNVPEDGTECESFTITSMDSLLVYENKYYLQVYLDS